MKRDFLAVYDYDAGGIWVLIAAREAGEIERRYPFLTVVEKRPAWMTDANFAAIHRELRFDIDQEPTGWLLGADKEFRKTPNT